MEVLDELSLVVWVFLQMREQRAVLTSDSMVFWREEMLGVVVVGMKLVTRDTHLRERKILIKANVN